MPGDSIPIYNSYPKTEQDIPYSSSGRTEVLIPYASAGNGETVFYTSRRIPQELNLYNSQNKSELSFYQVTPQKEEIFIGGGQKRNEAEYPIPISPRPPSIPMPGPSPSPGPTPNPPSPPPPIDIPTPPEWMYEVGCPGDERPYIMLHPSTMDCINLTLPERSVFSGKRFKR